MLMLRAWGARLSWAAAAASVLIIVMSPDEFEKWSEKSIFRLDKSSKGYQDRADELVALVRIAKGGS
ncbi:hypothetical protein [Stenotrophomonas maltophilia]|uniref:Uncharacterized protein n=2 Tax=Stenotrophomonas TaxID=40323 RepID=A0A4S2CVE1_STEMA|nr:hypothetical protein [Stenotrophomonas maltophilia]TGY32889.1 hypothetical protein E5352_14635 [Stenotrophomonas maltophilia]